MERLLAPLDSFLMNYSINKQIEEQMLVSMQNQQINQKSQQFISSNPKSQHAINQSCRTINDLNIKLGQIINQQNSQMLNSSICTVSSLNTNHGENNSFGNLSKFLQFCNQKLVQNNKRKASVKQEGNQNYQLQSIQVSLPTQSQNLQMNQPQPKNFQGGTQQNLQEKVKNILPINQMSSQQLNNSNYQNAQNLAQQNTQNFIQQNVQNFSNSNQSKNNCIAQTKGSQISSVNQLQNNKQNIQNRPPSHTFHNAPIASDLDTKSKVIQQKIQEQINLKKDILINKLITSQKNYSKTPEKQHLISNQPMSQLLLDQEQVNIGSSTDRNIQQGSQSQKLTLELKRNESQQLEQMKKPNSSKSNSITKQQEKELLKKLFVSKQKQSNIFQNQNNDVLSNFNGQLSPAHSQPLFQNQSPNLNLNSFHNDYYQQTQQNKNQKTEAAFKHPNIPKLNLASTVLLQQEQIPNKLITQNSQVQGKLTPTQNQTKLQGKRSDSVQQSTTYSQQQLHNNNNNPLYTTRNNKQEDIKIHQYSPQQKPQYARSTSPQNTFESRIINSYSKKIYDNPSLQIMNSERLHASRNQSKNVSPQFSPLSSNSQLLTNPILQKQLIYAQESNIAKTQATKPHEGAEELKNLYYQLQKKQQQLGICGLDSNKENSKIHKAIMNSRDVIDCTGQQSPQAFNGPATYILKGRHKSYHNHLTYSNQQVSGNQLIQSSQLNSGSPSSINCKASPYIKPVGMPCTIQNNNNCTSSLNGLGKNSTGITSSGTGVSKIASLSNRTSFMPNSRDNSNLKMSQNESSRNNNDQVHPNNSALLNIVNENQQYNKQNDGLISTILANNSTEDRTIPKKLNLNLTLLQQRNSCSNDQQPLLTSNRQLEEKKRADTSRLNKQNSSSNIGGGNNNTTNKVVQNNIKNVQNINKKMQKSYSTHHSRNNSNKGIDGLAKNQHQSQQKSNQSILSRVNSSKQYTQQNNNAATILMTEYNGKHQQENIILNSNIILNNLISNNSQACPSVLRGSTVASNINTNPNFNYTGGTLNTDINIIQPTEINNYEYLVNNQKNSIQAPNQTAGFLTDRTHYAQNVKKNSQVQQQIQLYQQQQLKQNTKNQVNKMSEIQTNFNKPQKKSSQYEQYLQQQINELRNNSKLNYKSTNQLTTQGHTKTKSDVSAVQYTNNLNTNAFWNQTKGTMNTRITEANNSGIGQQIFSKNSQHQNVQQQYLQVQNEQQLYLQQTDRPAYNQISQQQKETIINEQKQSGSSTARVQSAQGHNNNNSNSSNNINKKVSNTNGSKTPSIISHYSNNNINQNFNPYSKVLMNNYAGNNQMIQQSDLQQQNFSKKQQLSPVIRAQQNQNGYIQDQLLTNIQMRDIKQLNLNQNSQKTDKTAMIETKYNPIQKFY
ncbi:hypothetical protein ABPG72_007891 [Tetrahymena utriculariae]